MAAPNIERFHAEASALLQHYSFDLAGYSTDHLISGWRQTYAASWIRAAVIEALYQGRYKAVSVEQILVFWLRRGQPLRHFNHEFEHIVCNQSDRRRHRKNRSAIPLSEASLSTSSTKSSVEQSRDRFNPQSYHSPSIKTESDLPPELKDPQLASQLPDYPASDQPSASNPSTELNHKLFTQKLASLGNELDSLEEPIESSPMESSNHNDNDDFEPPDNQILFDQIWQFSKRSAPSFESHHNSAPDDFAEKSQISRNDISNTSIHQFRPESDLSEFYLKLRAVAQKSHNSLSNPVD